MKKLLVIWFLGFVCNLSGEDVIAVMKDKVPDFTKVKPTIYEESLMPFRTAQKELDSLLIELSEVFWEFKKTELKVKIEDRSYSQIFYGE